MLRKSLPLCGAALLPAVAAAWQSLSVSAPTTQDLGQASPAEPRARDPRQPFGPAPRPSVGSLAPVSSTPRDGEPGWSLVPDGAPVAEATAEQLDDEIPLPNPALYEETDAGDVLVQPASGDPYFLGFAAGRHYPAPDESIDPDLVAQVQAVYTDGRPEPRTYAFAMMRKRITPERVAELEALGARVLGFHPHYALKLSLPAGAIDAVAAHDAVRWIGVPRNWQKVHHDLSDFLEVTDPTKPFEAWISLYESDLNDESVQVMGDAPSVVDAGGAPQAGEPRPLAGVWRSNGWMQRQLERMGAEVLDYNERIQAHRVLILPSAVESLTQLDFVQFVERNPEASSFHDESMGMINADDSRAFWTGGTNSRTVAGIVDSGVRYSHTALNHVFGVGWDESGAANAWADSCNHGTHVAGTMWSDGGGDLSRRGVARGLGWAATGRIFNVRIFATCSGSVNVSNVLGHLSTSYNDGSATTPRPHVTNHSWGSSPPAGGWVGSEANARAFDDNAWADAQLTVFSAGNDGPGASTIGLPGVAKNVLTVANVLDYNDAVEGLPSSIRSSSSRGPAADTRWKPNVAAPGRWINSASSTSDTAWMNLSGTSMAAPHVTGLAALIIDQRSDFAYLPERMSAHLMATAITKDNALLSSPVATHMRTYGAGRVDGTRAQWSTGGSHTSWAFSLSGSASTFREFTVPANATRLIAVMHYVESQSSAGASQALVNDYDMWLDQPPLTAGNNTGDWFAHQSNRDNTEIRILNNPIEGTWQLKVWPTSATGTSYFGVTVHVLTAATAPTVNLSVTANDTFVTPGTQVDVTATASTTGATASAIFMDSTSSGNVLHESTSTLMDGAVTNFLNNQHSGRDVELGNINPFFGRSVRWRTSWATEGVKSWSVTARGDNFTNPTQAVSITVDGTPPGNVGSLTSTSHTVGAWSNDPTIDFVWNAAPDNLSGIDGYSLAWANSSGGAFPNTTKNVEETQLSFTTPALANSSLWYFGVRAVDNCGNWATGAPVVGPYRIDNMPPAPPGVITSTTHVPNVQSCNTTVTVNWTAAVDALSGLSGYVGVWDTSPSTNPTAANNLAAGATSLTQNIGSSGVGRYFHLRARDQAGNLSTTRHFGPVLATTNLVATYCTGKTNSLGCVPAIGTNGVLPSKSAGNFTITATNVLNQKNGLLFWGFGALANPFHGGTMCVAAPTIRTGSLGSGGSALPANNCTGAFAFQFSTAYMNANGLNAGATVYCQWWSRDPAAAFSDSLSNAVRFTICQ